MVAANWFPVSERDLAVTVGSLFNPLGNAVGQVRFSAQANAPAQGCPLLPTS